MDTTGLKWYAVYTRPCKERKVAELLAEKGIEQYCPLKRVQRQWSDRKKIIYEPLLTSYVLVRVDEKRRHSVLQAQGVVGFVSFLGRPAVIRDEEIDIIRKFLEDHPKVQVERMSFHVNEKVRIIGGPFMSLEGSVMGVKSRTVKILLPSLGFALVAEIDRSNVDKMLLSRQESLPSGRPQRTNHQ